MAWTQDWTKTAWKFLFSMAATNKCYSRRMEIYNWKKPLKVQLSILFMTIM